MHRFTDTNKWSEDWYCELKGEYQKLWDYICDHCDNAGIWKPNKIDFEIKTGFKVSLDSFLKKVNGDKLRIVTLANGRWFILGFIQYQWFTKKQQSYNLVLTNPRHKHIYEILIGNGIDLKMVRGLKEVWKTSMAKAKEEDGFEEKGGMGEKTEMGFGEEFEFNTTLPYSALEAAERNQFALTRNKNTEFIQEQWQVFLAERIHDPPEKRSQYRQLSDLTSYFLNWIRKKHPTNDTANKQTFTNSHQAKPGTSKARIEKLSEW